MHFAEFYREHSMWGNVTQSSDCACHPSLMYMLTCIGLVSTVWKFLLWFLFCELRKSQKLDTQNFQYSKFLVLYKFIQLHVIFVVLYWLLFDSTLRTKYRFYSIVPGCPTPMPNPRGPLPRAMPSPAITAANKEISWQLTAKSLKRGHYHWYIYS